MKTHDQARMMFRGVIALLALLTAKVCVALPDNEFACQVQTRAGAQGLVLVQAHTKEKAVKAASGASALTANGTYSKATAVVECIRRPGETFRDTEFKRFYQNAAL